MAHSKKIINLQNSIRSTEIDFSKGVVNGTFNGRIVIQIQINERVEWSIYGIFQFEYLSRSKFTSVILFEV